MKYKHSELTRKNSLALLVLVLASFLSFSQDLEFVHSYGLSEDGFSGDQVLSSAFNSQYDKVIISGHYSESINLEIGSNTESLVTSNSEIFEGFISFYDSDFNFVSAFSMASTIQNAKMVTDSTFVVVGRYIGLKDLDPRPDYEDLRVGSVSGDGFIGYYKLDGTPQWIHTLNSLYMISLNNLIVTEDQIIFSAQCDGDDLELNYFGETILLPNIFGMNTFLSCLNFSGNQLWNKLFDMENDHCYIDDLSYTTGLLSILMHFTEGVIDVSLIEEQQIEIGDLNYVNGYVGTYDLDNLELLNYTEAVRNVIDGEFIYPQALSTIEYLNLTSTYRLRGSNNHLSATSETEIHTIESIDGLDMLYLNCANQNGDFLWEAKVYYDAILSGTVSSIDKYGYTYVAGYFTGSIIYNETEMQEQLTGSDHGYVLKIDPSGDLVWFNEIRSTSGENEIKSIFINDNYDMVVSGLHSGSDDFDFSSNNEIVWSNEEDNGFIACG